MQKTVWTRRGFLRRAGSGAATAAVAPTIWTGARGQAGKSMTPEEFRTRVKGPILSFPTPYKADFAVDYEAVRRMIGRALPVGVGVVTLTAGNNQYEYLSYDEIRELTRVMVEEANGKAVTIAATNSWWTGQTVDYARFAESVGADAIQVLMPTVGNEEGIFQMFKAIADATRLKIVLHGEPSIELMDRLVKIEAVAGFKEEYAIEYSVPFYQRYGDRLAIFAGGTKSRFLQFRPYGMQAYYSTFATFVPEFAMGFWRAAQNDEQSKLREYVFRYDVPFFKRWSHEFWRATLEHFGVARRHQRPPQPTFDDRQMAELKTFYDGLGLSR